MQAHRQRRKLTGGLVGACLGSAVMASTDGCHHLLDEPDLTVGSGLERTQVARLETEVGHLLGRARNHHRVAVVVAGAGDGVDQPELLEIGEQLLRIDACTQENVPVPDAEGSYFYASPHRPSRMALVQMLVGGELGLVFRARGDTLTIGRENNDVNFAEDPFISGHHAQILALEDGRFQITDLGSKNGTYEKVPTLMQLFTGDQVFLGQQLLRVEIA